MIIDCPSCASAYHIARASLGENGRKLRCARCREVWHATPATDTEDHLPGEGTEITAEATSERSQPASFDELYGETRATVPPGVRRASAWKMPRPSAGTLAGIALVASGMGAVAGRHAVVRHVPATARLYAAIGLPVNLRGLDLRHVTSTLTGEGAQRVLAVEGEIANLAAMETALPMIAVAVRGADARNIYSWTASPPKAKLQAGETIPFRARLAAPPEGARDVVVRFEPAGAAIKEARK